MVEPIDITTFNVDFKPIVVDFRFKGKRKCRLEQKRDNFINYRIKFKKRAL